MESSENIKHREDIPDSGMKEKVELFITGELDADAHQEVLDWISASDRNRRDYDGLRAALRVAEYYNSDRDFDIQHARSRLNTRIELAGEERKTDFRILFRIAASLLLLVTTYIVVDNIREHKATQTESVIYNTIESPFGSIARICLPDSTFCVLNAGSTLRYPANFLGSDRREVVLSGEGFFEVRKDKRSEFVLRVGDIEIAALGTIFNVKAYPEESVIEATLVEGLLRIGKGDQQNGAVYLRPNEKISIVKEEGGILSGPVKAVSGERIVSVMPDKIPIREVHVEKRIDPVTETSWKESEWVIRNKTMEELSVMLERRYNVEITLENADVGAFSFSGTLKDETLEQVLFAIRSTAPIDYEIDGNRIVLTQNSTLLRKYKQVMKNRSGAY